MLLTLFLVQICAALVASNADGFLDEAIKLMEESPLLDTHIDLPQIIRSLSMKLSMHLLR